MTPTEICHLAPLPFARLAQRRLLLHRSCPLSPCIAYYCICPVPAAVPLRPALFARFAFIFDLSRGSLFAAWGLAVVAASRPPSTSVALDPLAPSCAFHMAEMEDRRGWEVELPLCACYNIFASDRVYYS